MSRRSKVILVLAILPGCLLGALMLLRILGLIGPFSMPAGSMSPTISPGDYIVMEGMTFLWREPHRGDIVVFKTDGISPRLPTRTLYVKRVVGEPGDHVRISAGKLLINGEQLALSNALGEIAYDLPSGAFNLPLHTNVTVPGDCYFVIGDCSTNSFDSRFWGSLPRANIIGRVSFCYWPPQRIGAVD